MIPDGPDAVDELAEEVPVGFSYAGVSHAVMMATPADLEDFAVGFSLTEGIAGRAEDVRTIAVAPGEEGLAVEIGLAAERLRAYLAGHRVRGARGHTSCGLCGVRDLADIAVTMPAVPPGPPVELYAIRHAIEALREHQPLSRRTRAAHAAAWCDPEGRIMQAREDVGRHNALDKLIGALARSGTEPRDGFCLITSRCSFEMVQKSVAARFPTLVAISAPTALAARAAAEAGLRLIANAGRLSEK